MLRSTSDFDRLDAVLSWRSFGRLAGAFIDPVGDNDLAALLTEPPGNRPPDALPRAGDHADLVLSTGARRPLSGRVRQPLSTPLFANRLYRRVGNALLDLHRLIRCFTERHIPRQNEGCRPHRLRVFI